MKLILSTVSMTIVGLCIYSFKRMSSVVEELLSFVYLNFNDFSIISHNLVSKGWSFMKLILSINNHSVMLHVNIMSWTSVVKELLPFDCLYINEFVHSEPSPSNECVDVMIYLTINIYCNVWCFVGKFYLKCELLPLICFYIDGFRLDTTKITDHGKNT